MVSAKHRDPELEAVVERVRVRLAARGELRPPRTGGFTSALPVDAQEIVRHWLDDGGYRRALEVVALEDPDLANQ
jgi:hypothetical protein